MNNRLRLECLAAVSKVFRDFAEPIDDDLLANIVFALPKELLTANGNGHAHASSYQDVPKPPESPQPKPPESPQPTPPENPQPTPPENPQPKPPESPQPTPPENPQPKPPESPQPKPPESPKMKGGNYRTGSS